MSDPENFLQRWARRKRETSEVANEVAPAAPAAESPDAAAVDAEPKARPAKPSVAAEPAFDPASLPPLESISAETDIRAFLGAGVPPELTRAALQRAWTADPKIRDFVGLAENAWDFNAPGAMPGFGPLEMTEELRRLVAQSLGGIPGPVPPENVAEGENPKLAEAEGEALPEPRPGERPGDKGESSGGQREPSNDGKMTLAGEDSAAPHQDSAAASGASSSVRRTHGGALPK